jgi:ABC-2 type transport system permease protein
MNRYQGTASLLRLALRRDRFVLPTWVFVLGSLTSFYYVQFQNLYPTQASREVLVATTKANPAWVALSGPLASNEVGALALWKSSITIVVLSLAVILTVIRHGRADEEFGRRELLESTPVGRLAHPCVAVTMGVIAATGTGLVEALMLIAVKAPVAGSLLAGSALALTGVAFATIAAVVGELTQSARGARLLAGGVLAATFVVRAAGDVRAANGSGWLTWLSPLGWANSVEAFGANKWWVLVLPAALALVLTPVVFALDLRRDIGSGVVQPRAGRVSARGWLRSSLALAWRLQRTTFFAWALLFITMGYVLGSSAKSLSDTLNSSPQLAEWLARLGGVGGATDLYNAVVINVMGLFAAAFAVQSVLRLHSEEESGRVEPVLAAAVSRVRWMSSHTAVAFAGSAALMVLLGLATGLSQDPTVQSSGHSVGDLVAASLVQVPAVWLVAAVALLLFAALPKWAMGAWVVYVLVFIAGVVVPAAWPNSRAADLSPFTHIPKLPAAQMSWIPLIWLMALVVLALAFGYTSFKRRDIR